MPKPRTPGTPKKKPGKRGPAPSRGWEEKFLDRLRADGSVTHACKAAKVGRTLAYRRRAEDPGFAASWAEALELAGDALEDEVRSRALNRKDKASHLLLMFALKALRPKYRDTRPPAGPEEVAVDADVVTRAAERRKAREARLADGQG